MRKRNHVLIGIIALVSLASSIVLMYVEDEAVQLLIQTVELPILIYFIYWQCTFQGDLKKETGEGKEPWPHFWATVLTLGIYAVYWHYAAGKRLNKLGAKDRSLVYMFVYFVSYVISIVLVTLTLLKLFEVIDYDSIILNIILWVNTLIPYALFMHMQYTANFKLADNVQTAQNLPV